MRPFALLAAALLLAGCSARTAVASGPESPGPHRISATQAHQMMSELADFVILDVRTPQEFGTRRIEGAVLLPYREIRAGAGYQLPDKTRVILVYCQAGRRSAIAAGELAALGYTNVYDFGGIDRWPYGTVSDRSQF